MAIIGGHLAVISDKTSLKRLVTLKPGYTLHPDNRRLLGRAFSWTKAANRYPRVSVADWQLLYRGQRPLSVDDKAVFLFLLGFEEEPSRLPSIPVEEDIWL